MIFKFNALFVALTALLLLNFATASNFDFDFDFDFNFDFNFEDDESLLMLAGVPANKSLTPPTTATPPNVNKNLPPKISSPGGNAAAFTRGLIMGLTNIT